jgi:hypothetical protein
MNGAKQESNRRYTGIAGKATWELHTRDFSLMFRFMLHSGLEIKAETLNQESSR